MPERPAQFRHRRKVAEFVKGLELRAGAHQGGKRAIATEAKNSLKAIVLL
jgi:hypothetical protein